MHFIKKQSIGIPEAFLYLCYLDLFTFEIRLIEREIKKYQKNIIILNYNFMTFVLTFRREILK